MKKQSSRSQPLDHRHHRSSRGYSKKPDYHNLGGFCVDDLKQKLETDRPGLSQVQSGPSSEGVVDVQKVKGESDDDSDEGENVEVEDDDGFDETDKLWAMMNVAMYDSGEPSSANPSADPEAKATVDCDHSFVHRDDLGSVCRVCGLVEKHIAETIDYGLFEKKKGSGRTYKYERGSENGSYSRSGVPVPDGWRLDENSVEVPVHPKHRRAMKDHQFEGLRFLMRNLMAETPQGCIMAHAPGSGKTFMIISFLQVFMVKHPSARPLIVLPRGIITNWKKEFQKWQVEDLPLHDFYSTRAESRRQQLEILREWGEKSSILFLSYKQFSVIARDGDNDSEIDRDCRDFLLLRPSVLIMDEGHTARNEDTETLSCVAKVKTPRKVVLSGTLYQNHVKEVFNVLNLVRPDFLKLAPASSIKRRIMSKVDLSGKRASLSDYSDDQFYEAVERTIISSIDSKREVEIIQDLRDMTRNVLHYYKGDSLDELPGLVDFTVFLQLSARQKKDIAVLKRCKNRFKIFSEGSGIYVHPRLNSVLRQSGKVDVDRIDGLILEKPSNMGAKARFFLSLLNLCEANGEKLLVFSQFLGPLKFLERLAMKKKNYTVGREIFVITGDSNSDIRDMSVEQFNTSCSSRVFFGSIKACGEGISLVGASRIIILDTHLNPSITRQAIGRAFRPGQQKIVYTYRLVAVDSPEEEDQRTCFRKECIAKMWFEWHAYQGLKEFEMEEVNAYDCGDMLLQMLANQEDDVVSVCKRAGHKGAEADAFSSLPVCDVPMQASGEVGTGRAHPQINRQHVPAELIDLTNEPDEVVDFETLGVKVEKRKRGRPGKLNSSVLSSEKVSKKRIVVDWSELEHDESDSDDEYIPPKTRGSKGVRREASG